MAQFAGQSIWSATWALGFLFAPAIAEARMALIAHRGASARAPENTLASFNQAKTVADFVEFDVRPTKDGQLVVIHDDTVDRTTNGRGPVGDRTLAEIRQLDAGSWFSRDFAGEKIPTAEETIAAIQTEAAPFMERKGGTVGQFVALLNRQPLRPEGVVMSFDYAFVTALKRAKPEVQVGWIGQGALTVAQIARAMDDGVSHFIWASADLDAATVHAIHQAGGLVMGWTVNQMETVAALSDLGVDGIVTDLSLEYASAPEFTSPFAADRVQPPTRTVLRMGSSAVLAAMAPGHSGRRVEWRRPNDPTVIGTGPLLKLRADSPQSFGRYVASWVERGESIVCDHVVDAGSADNQLVNISARMTIGVGEATGIVGFVVKSAHAPRFLLRAVGPSLASLGVVDPVANPLLTLFRRGTVIDSETVGSRTNATGADFARNGAFPLMPAKGDVAIMRNLEGGAYTVHLSTTSRDAGIGLIEVYQDNSASNWAAGAASNLSLRGRAIPGSPLIGGFVVPDGSSQTVLIRGIGPSLARFGITEPLRDPTIRICDSSRALVAGNDDWWSEGDSGAIQEVTAQVGGFPIAAGRDAAVLVTLAPGAYTAILADAAGDRQGVGLLEIYAVDFDLSASVRSGRNAVKH